MRRIIQPTLNYTTVPLLTEQQKKERDELRKRAVLEEIARKRHEKRGGDRNKKPASYERPAFNTPQYWQDWSRGWITDEQALTDQAGHELRRKRALDSKHNKSRPPHRHGRAGPRSSKQFAKSMSTQAARDDRLTPQSKALLQVLVARTGRGRRTDTTKTTLGKIMNRCPRSIQRYIRELVEFGYLRTQTIKSRRTGFYIGLRIWIMNSVLPFWAAKNEDYEPENWFSVLNGRRKPEGTEVSLTNNTTLIKNTLESKKPPWFAEFVFAGGNQA